MAWPASQTPTYLLPVERIKLYTVGVNFLPSFTESSPIILTGGLSFSVR